MCELSKQQSCSPERVFCLPCCARNVVLSSIFQTSGIHNDTHLSPHACDILDSTPLTTSQKEREMERQLAVGNTGSREPHIADNDATSGQRQSEVERV